MLFTGIVLIELKIISIMWSSMGNQRENKLNIQLKNLDWLTWSSPHVCDSFSESNGICLIWVNSIFYSLWIMSIFSDDGPTGRGSFSTDLSNGNNSNVDQELQDFLMLEKQKAQFNAQVNSQFNLFLSLIMNLKLSVMNLYYSFIKLEITVQKKKKQNINTRHTFNFEFHCGDVSFKSSISDSWIQWFLLGEMFQWQAKI